MLKTNIGRKSKTPLHYVSKVANQDFFLDRFLEACPDSILDVTTQNSTALHIAVENRRLDVLQVLLRTLMKTAYHREVVNRKDENGNTALHIAASSNEAQMLKLLLNCKADKHATDQAGLTALGVSHQHGYTESITGLRGCFIQVVSKFIPKLEKQTASYVTKASSLIFRDMDNISGENRNALLDSTSSATCVSCSMLSPINIFHCPNLFSINNSLSSRGSFSS
ncbi:ankyrin repeat-containing protein BDA1-like [Hibiscus syriacus]|uniref:ankyrin repeat-containing protein BDA1-like n=1 Tax=Hibiscus syriacus TaxID=106335 RepID=UPI00192208F6|nr:ankyrin repeat-containing protein BDA1-like [Hibiscus syriacus]